MNVFSTLFGAYGLCVMAGFVFTLTGYLIRKGFKLSNEKIEVNLFFNGLVGTLIWITGIALYYTGGKTIFIIFPLLGAITVYLSKKQILKPEKTVVQSHKYKKCLLYFFVLTFLFGWQCLRILHFTSDNQAVFTTPHPDFIYYSQVSTSLIEYGQENTFIYANAWIDQFYGTELYHYLDTWLTGFLSFASGLSPIICLQTVTLTWYGFLTVSGGLAVMALFNKTDVKSQLFWIAMLWLPLHFPFEIFKDFHSLLGGTDILVSGSRLINLGSTQKLFYVYPFIWVALMAAIRNNKLMLFIALFSVCLATATLISSVLFILGLFLIFTLIYQKNLRKSAYWLAGILFIITYFFIFYYINSSDQYSSGKELNLNYTLQSIQTMMNIMVKSAVQYFLLFIIPIVYSILYLRKTKFRINYNLPVILIGLPAGGLITWCLLHDVPDSVQPFYLAVNIIIHGLLLLGICYFKLDDFFDLKNKIKTVLSALFFSVSVLTVCYFIFTYQSPIYWWKYHPEFEKIFNKNKIVIGGFFQYPEQYKDIFSFNTFFRQVNGIMGLYFKHHYVINLSGFEAINYELKAPPNIQKITRKMTETSMFYQWAKVSGFTEPKAAQIAFIRKFNLQYLIAKDTLPAHLQPLRDFRYAPFPIAENEILYVLKFNSK